MKPLFLALSLLANAALLAAFAFRPVLAPPALRGFLTRHFHADESLSATAPSPAPASRAAAQHQLWADLKTDDLPALVARLRAAGFPLSLIRAIVGAEVGARYDARMRALTEPDPNAPYWKQSNVLTSDSPNYAEYTRLQRERSNLLRDLFRDSAFASDDVSAAQRRRFGDLSRRQIDLVQRIEDDYNEMGSALRAAMKGVTLPEDRDKLALLAREKHADLAAVLSPDELADYDLRTSPIVNLLGRYLGGFEPSDAEFRAVFQAQQTYSNTVSAGSAGLNSIDAQTRQTAQRQLNADLKATLGDARYAEYQRETNRDFQQLARLTQQENLAPGAALQAFNLRDAVAAESNRIADDPSLTPDDKSLALQTLAQTTRTRTLALLGPTAGPAYLKIQDTWLNNVERGSAVTFTNNIATSSISTSNASGTMAMLTFTGGPSFRSVRPPAPRPAGP